METMDQQYVVICPRCGELPSFTWVATGANGNLWCLACFNERDERHDVQIRPRT